MASDNRRAKLRMFTRLKNELIVIFATLLFIICTIPVSVFFIIPCFIYRKAVILLAKYFKPELGKLLCARSALASIDELYTSPKCTLLGVAVVRGDIDVQQLKDDIMRRIITAKTAKGELMYPELKSYFTQWCGFVFWKWVKEFNIDDHVTVLQRSETETMNELDIVNLRIELISKPYTEGVSPWEFVVVKNYVPTQPLMIDIDNNSSETGKPVKKSVLIMRIHHGVTDGYSLLKLFLNSMQAEKLKLDDIPQPKYRQRNCFQWLLYYAWAGLCIPYYVTSQLMMTYDNNFFHPKGVKLVRKCSAAGTTLPVSVVREIKEKYNVTFSSVLMSAVAGGVRNFMLSHGIPIPEKMHVTTPLPWTGHPSKLRNFWSFCIQKLPLEVADSTERLKVLHEKREAIVRSTIPYLNLILVPLVGSLPTPVIQWVTKRKATTIMMSNFPGPQEPSSMFGYQILDASFGGGFGRGNLAFGISAISYNGTMRMGLGVDKSILPEQKDAQELMNLIRDELYALSKDAIV